jgi:hypothetical protein
MICPSESENDRLDGNNGIYIFKYHVSSADWKISVRKIEIAFIFRLYRRPIQFVMLVTVGISFRL